VSDGTSEILLFQVGARVFAAEVYDVVRVGSLRGEPPGFVVPRSALGEPFGQHRGIVVASHEDGLERMLVVDHVLGVRSVPEADVHPLPAFAAECLQSPAVTGFVLIDEAPTLLVDLPTLVREQRASVPAATPA
jgi:chemotaxis signal transduction protein